MYTASESRSSTYQPVRLGFCRTSGEQWQAHIPADTLELLLYKKCGVISTMSVDLGYNAGSVGTRRRQMYPEGFLDDGSNIEYDDNFISGYAVTRVAHKFGHGKSSFETVLSLTLSA